ncbi:immunity protein Imm33 domain-containing protein [Gemmata sp.]|uniref:immunity protein Imm33 domain-containing protein n=1 Tax=Gemmata sp. TaxID=1914242 RepID=UPI003F6F8929
MATVRTSKCHRHGHPEFRLTFDTNAVPVDADVGWLIDWLETAVASGTRFAPNETCQIGWGTTLVRAHESGDLSLWEPDMRSVPFEWVESVSATLAHLRLQKDVAESVLREGDMAFPSMLTSAIVCARLGPNQDIVLERVEPAGADSGWFCGCLQRDHDHNNARELRRVSLYEAAVRAPQIVPFLALPAGVLVATDHGVPTILHGGKPLAFARGSYLAMRFPDQEAS